MAIAVGLLALAVFAASCSSGSSDSDDSKSSNKPKTTSTTTPVEQAAATPVGAEAAVAEYLKGQGIEYVGDCADALLPRDKGKWCSSLDESASTDDKKVYELGPVGEKPEKIITITRNGSAELTPGYQVGVADGNVGAPQQLTEQQLASNTFITGNLILDQQAGIGNGLRDLPTGAPGGTGGTGAPGGTGGTGAPGGTTPPVVTIPPNAGPGTYPVPPRGIVVENPNVQVGGEVAFSGTGCEVNEPLVVLFDGQPIGTISADVSGAFAGSISIPPGTAPGVHTLSVRGANCSFNATITVRGALAFTGSSSHTTTYVLGALAAIMVGFVLVFSSRRRRNGVRGRQAPPPTAA